jgi:hypothetical protein
MEGRTAAPRAERSRPDDDGRIERRPRERDGERTATPRTERTRPSDDNRIERRTRERGGEDRTSTRRDRDNDGRVQRDGRRYEHDRERTATRNHSREGRSYRGWSGHQYTGRSPYHTRGRVSRLSRWGNGYHVWIHGAPYPFYIPLSYYHRHGLRIGLTIALGGYYNDHGYYEYYDDYDRYDRYNRSDDYSRGEIRGYVESVDYRDDSFVVRNDATGNYVTVENRDRGNVREGDYVEVSGEWRRGVLYAYDVDRLDRGDYGR